MNHITKLLGLLALCMLPASVAHAHSGGTAVLAALIVYGLMVVVGVGIVSVFLAYIPPFRKKRGAVVPIFFVLLPLTFIAIFAFLALNARKQAPIDAQIAVSALVCSSPESFDPSPLYAQMAQITTPANLQRVFDECVRPKPPGGEQQRAYDALQTLLLGDPSAPSHILKAESGSDIRFDAFCQNLKARDLSARWIETTEASFCGCKPFTDAKGRALYDCPVNNPEFDFIRSR
jgi:hypothetical protein